MRTRVVRLTLAVAALALLVFGAPLAVGVARYLMADQYRQLQQVADAAAIAVSGDLTAATPAPLTAGTDTRFSLSSGMCRQASV